MRGYPKDFKISDLRKCIKIEKPVLTNDSIGGQTESWVVVENTKAKVTPMTASQRFYAGQLNHNITHKVVIRKCQEIKSKMRVMLGTRVLHIHGVIDVHEEGRFYELMCSEGTAS